MESTFAFRAAPPPLTGRRHLSNPPALGPAEPCHGLAPLAGLSRKPWCACATTGSVLRRRRCAVSRFTSSQLPGIQAALPPGSLQAMPNDRSGAVTRGPGLDLRVAHNEAVQGLKPTASVTAAEVCSGRVSQK